MIRECVVPIMNERFLSGTGMFMHDNAPSHKSNNIHEMLVFNGISILS